MQMCSMAVKIPLYLDRIVYVMCMIEKLLVQPDKPCLHNLQIASNATYPFSNMLHYARRFTQF